MQKRQGEAVANIGVLKLVYAGVLIAIGVILPQAFHIFRTSCRKYISSDSDSGISCRNSSWSQIWPGSRNHRAGFKQYADRYASCSKSIFYDF
nr:hypothetical protein [uncultured Sellimonas sp.]